MERTVNKKHMLNLVVIIATCMPCIARAGDKNHPPPELIGTWSGTVEIFGSFKVQPYPSKAPEDHQKVTITINSYGTVTGNIGNAIFKKATIHKNRSWIGRKLNLKSDYIVSGGTLQGKVTPQDKGTNSKFTVPFNIEEGKLKGTIMLIPKFPLTRPLNLTKQKKNP